MNQTIKQPLMQAIVALMLVSCSSSPKIPIDNTEHWVVNGCLIEAVIRDAAFKSYARLNGTDIPRGILLIANGAGEGHAMCCFEWEGIRYAWDEAFGSRRTYAQWDNPRGIAVTMYPGVVKAEWLEGIPPQKSELAQPDSNRK